MRPRLVVWSSIALLGLSLGAASQGCELVVSDGSYKVSSSSGSNASSGTTSPSSGTTSPSSGTTSPSSGTTAGANTDCTSCEQAFCSAEYHACQANPACVSFAQCEAKCTTQSCQCEQSFPNGASLWLALNTCATTNCGPSSCGPCPTMGVGDPCTDDLDCEGSALCSEWCTQECMVSSDCAGMDFSSQNLFGQGVYCILNGANVDSCFPGCTTNADCQAFAGTDCEPANAVDNPSANISICTLPADAGTN